MAPLPAQKNHAPVARDPLATLVSPAAEKPALLRSGLGLTRHPQRGTAELPKVYGGQRVCFQQLASSRFNA